MGESSPQTSAASTVRRAEVLGQQLLRTFPPVRLAWIFLAGLGGYEAYFLAGLGVSSLLLVPLLAALADLTFQRVRFPAIRFPDAALVTGLFVALILPPTAPLLLAGTVAFVGVGTRHVLRFRGRPWLNPAVVGVVLGVLFLGLAPAWWVGIGPYGEVAMVALGALLLLRAPRGWRLPVVFLLTYGLLAIVQHVVVGATNDPRILLLQVVDPATLFFALFMMVEPRTAPVAAHQQVLYAGTVGIAAAFLPSFFPTIGILLSLLVGNLLSVVLRRGHPSNPTASPSSRPQGGRARRVAALAARTAPPARSRWPVGYRVTAGIVVLIVLVGVIGATPRSSTSLPVFKVAPPPGSGGGGGGITSACQSDNPSISATDLSALHKALGPSVILSYSAATGVVVFYDPANQVTVTESDLYEDYGFAEFNGDDYAVNGCAP